MPTNDSLTEHSFFYKKLGENSLFTECSLIKGWGSIIYDGSKSWGLFSIFHVFAQYVKKIKKKGIKIL